MENKIDKIRMLIAQGNTGEALKQALLDFPEMRNEISTLSGKYKWAKKKELVGTMDDSKLKVLIAEININLLELLDFDDNEFIDDSDSPIITFFNSQLDFFRETIKDFQKTKSVLFFILLFIVIIGIASIIFLNHIMPPGWGQIILLITIFSFMTLVISALGFIITHIKIFQNKKSNIRLHKSQQNHFNQK